MNENPKGWRGSADLWLDAAYQLLVTSGVEAVKILPLAKAVRMSRPSFYWHFEDREALLDALIARWDAKNTGNLVAQTRQHAVSIAEALFNLFDCWLDEDLFDAKLDFAIRNWAQSAPNLKTKLEIADQTRVKAITDMFVRHGFNPFQSDIRASAIYYTQVGYIAMMVEEPKSKRIERMPAYIETFTGNSPTESEIARFKARHLGSSN
ncbi:TetR/AcrR family transcriptional regulator [Pseudohalocynthiibacter aestuariivivens]|jgi:AcrR family transcriptional regulator|uniref:TetR/AcrR family transcriptional regulator n=1 Tax=Pseudohalocynthiibacter aestuariivivens TaxID=1591409 RepID=A0ABV5JB92_9RHOB|nr:MULTISPECIES: TetR/AcrR family transcriptional regulator [Pseudohalocynthiibacter]MBS9715855.1 TetR/AcrR family transcriptional regulator [Pseudohalocynthiibacter aestuariivivens]MCK0101468.1 TetR/AcrR family transcriptional regulator [Pseudohalocynthiibacter sp. F2068]